MRLSIDRLERLSPNERRWFGALVISEIACRQSE